MVSLGLSQDPPDSECSTLTHFSMSLARNYVNLKKPYNQDIKEQVTTIIFLKNKANFTWNQKLLFKFNLLLVMLTFQIKFQ